MILNHHIPSRSVRKRTCALTHTQWENLTPWLPFLNASFLPQKKSKGKHLAQRWTKQSFGLIEQGTKGLRTKELSILEACSTPTKRAEAHALSLPFGLYSIQAVDPHGPAAHLPWNLFSSDDYVPSPGSSVTQSLLFSCDVQIISHQALIIRMFNEIKIKRRNQH